MSALETIEAPNGAVFPLGCLVPESFPTHYRAFADAFQGEMLTLAQVRAALVSFNFRSMYGRRERFAGMLYIRNQRSFGSCNGWSTAGALSRMRELRGEPYVCLSGADAYSQMNGGRDNGSTLEDGLKVVEANGIAPESLVPWDHVYTHQISAEAKAARARFKGLTCYAVDTEEELATALVLGRLGVVAVHASSSYMREDADGVCLPSNGVGNHSTGVQDIRLQPDGTLNYDEFGSWDVSNHTGGYTWLTWNRHFRESVKYHRFWVLVSTTDDAQDDSAPPKAKE